MAFKRQGKEKERWGQKGEKNEKEERKTLFFGLIKVRLKSRCVSTVYSKMAVEGTGGR